MKILWAYRGKVHTPGILPGAPTLKDVPGQLPVTHMSAVNDLLLIHWLKEMGHEVSYLVIDEGAPWYIPQVRLQDVDPGDWDVLMVFKLHAIRQLVPLGLLKLPWRRVVFWADFGGLANAIGGARVDAVCWGTDILMEREAPTMPGTNHAVVEHATTFVSAPEMGATTPRGLYAGRMPHRYKLMVEQAANICPMLIYSLKIEMELSKRWILLRPGQYTPEELAEAQTWAPKGSELRPAVNIHTEEDASRAAFGFVPATGPVRFGPQLYSACKFWDYLALGLPVVIADMTPEAVHVRAHPMLGELYTQDNGPSLAVAIERSLNRAVGLGFDAERRAIQNWVFSNHTWRHRAAEIIEAIS